MKSDKDTQQIEMSDNPEMNTQQSLQKQTHKESIISLLQEIQKFQFLYSKKEKPKIKKQAKRSIYFQKKYSFQAEQQYLLLEEIANKEKQLLFIKQCLFTEMKKNYYYPQNLEEIKQILEQIARKAQMIFREKQIGLEQYASSDRHEQILYLFSVIQNSLTACYEQFMRKKLNEDAEVKNLEKQREFLINNILNYQEFIERLKQYSGRQKQKIEALKAQIIPKRQKNQQDYEIINQIQQLTNSLNIRYYSRNQLLHSIRNLQGYLKEHNKDCPTKINNHQQI